MRRSCLRETGGASRSRTNIWFGLMLTWGATILFANSLTGSTQHKGGVEIVAAGHRVVHGGLDHRGPAQVTQALLVELETLAPLAPQHQPHNLAGIRACRSSAPGLPQVACFDTGFHRTQARLAQLFALPRALTETGVIRYGFHGLSYEYIASTLPDHLGDSADGRIDRGSPRQWREHVRDEGATERRHQHGLHRA